MNLLLTLLFLNLPFSALQDSLYQKGSEHLENGDRVSALNLWVTNQDQIISGQEGDFRIGLAFLEAAIHEERESLYPIASKFYMKGLNDPRITEYFSFAAGEAEKIIPLLDDEEATLWRQKIRAENPELLVKMKSFWLREDPSVSSPLNERLIEHYERINYARNHYNRNSRTVYGTDDRGLIYILYGKPDSTASGNFTLNSNKVQFFSREVIRQQNEERDMNRSDSQLTDLSGSGVTNAMIESNYLDNLAKAATDRVLSSRISSNYEIWIYERQLLSIPENLIFIFGQHADTGQYGIVNSPEDFIPQRSFRNRDIRVGNYRFNIGSILQLSLYDDLKFIDDKFNDIYYDLYDRLMSDQSIVTESASEYLQHRYAMELESNRKSAPVNLSGFDRYLRDVETNIETYEFLDDNLTPFKIVFLYSNPHPPLFSDYTRFLDDDGNPTEVEPSYHLRHRIAMFDSDWNRGRTQNDFPIISFADDEISGEFYPSVSSFALPLNENYPHLTITTSLFNETYASLSESAYNQLNTPGHLIAETTKPFSMSDAEFTSSLNRDQFEVSDLIIGYRGDFEFDEEILVPFYVPPKKEFTGETDLYFMFEVYNIPRNETGRHDYLADIQVTSDRERSFLRRTFRSEPSPEERITLEIESGESSSKQTLSLDISDYEPGNYTLNLWISSEESDVVIERSYSFTIRQTN